MKTKTIRVFIAVFLCLFTITACSCGNNDYKFQNAYVTIKWSDEYVKDHAELLKMVSHDFGDIVTDGSETQFVLSSGEAAYFQDSVLKKNKNDIVLSGPEFDKIQYNIVSQSDNVYSLDGQALSLFFWNGATASKTELIGQENNEQFYLIQKSTVNAEIKEVEYTYVFLK